MSLTINLELESCPLLFNSYNEDNDPRHQCFQRKLDRYTWMSSKFSILIMYKTIKEVKKIDEANQQFLIPISGTYGMCKYLDILIPNKIMVPFFVFFCLTYASGTEHILYYFDSKFQMKTRFHNWIVNTTFGTDEPYSNNDERQIFVLI